jgi:hypothetical protein
MSATGSAGSLETKRAYFSSIFEPTRRAGCMWMETFPTAALASFQPLQDSTLDREGVISTAADQKAGIGEE